jgi:hypothetical protein
MDTLEHAVSTPTKSPREKELEERLGGRTLLVVVFVIVAIVELLIIVRLSF